MYISGRGWPSCCVMLVAMALHKIRWLSSEVDKLGSSYANACREIESLKETMRQIKRQLKEARDDLESFETRTRADRLAKADKKTTIRELEHRLSLLRAALQVLNKARDRTFARREEIKVKMMEKMVAVMTSTRPVEIGQSEDVAVVSKVMEWLRVCPESEVGRLAGRDESLICEIRDACQRFNVVGVDFGGTPGS